MKQTEMMEKQDSEVFGASTEEVAADAEFAMEVSQASVTEEEIPKPPVALRLLRQIELTGMKIDYGRIARNRRGEEWYVGRSGVVQGPVTFREILEYLVDGGGTVNVLHESDKEAKDPQWTEFAYTPLWTQTWPARFWTLAFWGIAAIFGFCVIQAIVPHGFRRIVEIAYLVGIVGWVGYRLSRRMKKPEAEAQSPGSEPENGA